LAWKGSFVGLRYSLLRRLVLFTVCALPLMVAAGCRRASQNLPKQAAAAAHAYHVRGQIVLVDQAAGRVTLRHEAIPGFMEAMTMPYKLEDPSVMSELHKGDRITATLLADDGPAGATNLRLSEIVVIAQARPDYKPAVQYHVPSVGETVPDFKLLNQSGKSIGLRSFGGKVTVMTFIYTRCPVADFCPRMSRNFSELDKALAGDPAMYVKTHLLSVSFDPKNDTPAVLRSYGGAYTGRYVNETFGHWDFAAPREADLAAMEKFFAVGVTPGDGPSTLQHSLSTLVLDKQGRIAAFYSGNEWTVDEVLAKVRAVAAQA
jgi:protein SCO1/2